jgi:hypothetical protein
MSVEERPAAGSAPVNARPAAVPRIAVGPILLRAFVDEQGDKLAVVRANPWLR